MHMYALLSEGLYTDQAYATAVSYTHLQFMNVFCGGTLIQDLPFAEAHKMRTPDKYHNLYHRKGFFMYNLFGAESEVNTLHHQGVGRIGNGFEAVSVWNDGEDSVAEAI